MLVSSEKQQIKQLMQSPQWKAVERLAEMLCQKISDNSKVRDTEWETIQTLLTDEGEVRGIKRLIQELYKAASE